MQVIKSSTQQSLILQINTFEGEKKTLTMNLKTQLAIGGCIEGFFCCFYCTQTHTHGNVERGNFRRNGN